MNQDITMYDYIVQHCTESMNNALTAVRYTTWERNCPEFTDIEFVSKGVLRCISPVDSGRHFIAFYKTRPYGLGQRQLALPLCR